MQTHLNSIACAGVLCKNNHIQCCSRQPAATTSGNTALHKQRALEEGTGAAAHLFVTSNSSFCAAVAAISALSARITAASLSDSLLDTRDSTARGVAGTGAPVCT
jgi:hypothetical protein